MCKMIKNITEKIKYIGVDDTDIDLFESQYVVPDGVSYNSYLILDEKIAIMDTVDRRKCDEWLANLETALEGRTPDYLVVQHLEPDHAGSIAKVMGRYPNMQIVASDKAVKMLPQFYFDIELELGIFYYFFAILFIAGMVNSVNLTDGIDGLCSSVSAVVGAFFAVVAFVMLRPELAIFPATVIGGTLIQEA